MIAQISEELVWNQIVARAWCDDNFMNRLLSDTRAVLAEYDLVVAFDTDVEAVIGNEVRIDNTDSGRRFVLPAAPSHELMEEELVGEQTAAMWCYSVYSGYSGYCGCRCYC